MGLLSSFDTNRDHLNTSGTTGRLVVDLTNFIIGGTPIGKTPWDGDFFAQYLLQNETLKSDEAGYELGTKEGLLNYAFITLDAFQGNFLIQDQIVPLGNQTTKEEIIELFDAPYWTDIDDDEVILFYEYRKGEIELQFEFPDGQKLGYITLIQEGVLSDEEQRKSYGVTRPWPPE